MSTEIGKQWILAQVDRVLGNYKNIGDKIQPRNEDRDLTDSEVKELYNALYALRYIKSFEVTP